MEGSRCDLVLRDVSIPGGRKADISLYNGRVRHVGAPLHADEELNCRGKTVIPGGVDMHVHMRGGIQAHKEDWKSGTMSAVAGGVTVVVDQPNTVPPIMNEEILRQRVIEAGKSSLAGYAINGGVSPSADLNGLWRGGALAFGEIFAAPSSYGDSVSLKDLKVALERIQELGALATIHAEKIAGEPSENLEDHSQKRSVSGEIEAVMDVRGINTAGCRLHFCHMSTSGAVEAAGDATVEVTPHHLFLSLERFTPGDTGGKVNPPLRPESERRKIWTAWDRIDVVASDHAPHTVQEKGQSFQKAPSGIPGVETMVPLLVAEVRKGRIDLVSLIEKTSYRPCDILGIPRAGFSPGDRADFAVYPETMTKIAPELLHSKAGWTPFEGYDAVFPEIVVVDGRIRYREGEFFRGVSGWYGGRGYIGGRHKKNGADTAHS
ncbi:MAG TPA: dihydroorotase [Methanolinea sp.]|nr:dihydroorotase [Methanolinea sp.]